MYWTPHFTHDRTHRVWLINYLTYYFVEHVQCCTRPLFESDGHGPGLQQHQAMFAGCIGEETFTDLDYADDIALLAEMLGTLVAGLQEEAAPLGLQENWAKTKI